MTSSPSRAGVDGTTNVEVLVQAASLAPSSHNTQP